MNDTEETLHRLAAACRILAMEGHNDMTLGHLSVRDPAGSGFWMKRNQIGLDEVRGPQDFVLVGQDGTRLSGEGGVHSEWPIHAAVLAARPDVAFVAHTHPLHASILSGVGGWLRPYTVDGDYFGDIPVLRETTALIVTREEASAVATALGDGRVVFLAHHGVVFCGGTIEELVCTGCFLERAARIHLLGAAAGVPVPDLEASARARRHGQIMTARHWQHSFSYFMRRLEVSERVGPMDR